VVEFLHHPRPRVQKMQVVEFLQGPVVEKSHPNQTEQNQR
jgi:hypothetical protein